MNIDLRKMLKVIRDTNTEPSFILANNMNAGEFAFQYVLENYKKRHLRQKCGLVSKIPNKKLFYNNERK